MEEHYPVAIIGGGAAGLFAGAILGKKTIILEKGKRCGRKLLLTGGGRCNYTHDSTLPELLSHYNGKKSFIRPALYSLPPEKIIKRFKDFGIEPSFDENGKVFPLHGDSFSILNALETKCRIKVACEVKAIRKDKLFIIETNQGTITSDYLILAAGGNSYPHTGSDGSGYVLAHSLGHKIIPPTPALAPLKLSRDLSKAEGVSLTVTVKIDKKEYKGDIVITKLGISGPLAEDISYMFPTERDIIISFVDINIEKLRRENGKSVVKNMMPLPDRLIRALLGELSDKKIAELKKEEESFILNQLTAMKCTAKAIARGAMSTHGGINVDEVDSKTMESKLISNLYFAGDILDIDANCGGYSLTWAFATAEVAANAILRKEY